MTVVEARRSRPFADLHEFASRVDPRQINKVQLENLIRAGAFDPLEPNRARLFAGAETVLRRGQADAEQRDSGQIGLFARDGKPESLRLPEMPDWPPLERLSFEAEAIGFHLTAHPLGMYAAVLRRIGVVPSRSLEGRSETGRVKLAGVIVGTKERITRTGSRMAWVRLSDESGSFEVTVFSEVLARSRAILVTGASVIATVDLRPEGEALRVTAQDLVALEDAVSQAGAGMRIWLQKTEAVQHIRALLRPDTRGKGRVVLIPRIDQAQSVEIALPGGFHVTPRLAMAIKVIPGVERVEEV
jgi:DNA polymerase III subunit alpha